MNYLVSIFPNFNLKQWRLVWTGIASGVFLVCFVYGRLVYTQWKQQAKLTTYLAEVGNAPVTLGRINEQLAQFHNLQLTYGLSDSINQSDGLFASYLESICQRFELTLVQLPVHTSSQLETYQMIQTQFKVMGSYQAMTQLAHHLEEIDRMGRVVELQLTLQQVRTGSKKQAVLIGSYTLNRLKR